MSGNPTPEPEPLAGIDRDLERLRAGAVGLGRWSLGMVHDGWAAFDRGDVALAQAVLDRDERLDQLDQEIEHETIAFLVIRRPAAVALRTTVAVLKASTHLDRIGRLGFDIARMTTGEAPQGHPDVHALLQSMDQVAESMVEDSLESLAHGQPELARGLFVRDDQMDQMHRQTMRLVVRELEQDPHSAPRLSSELMVARHFERIADNACKIGEKTIYAITGQRRSEYLPRHPYAPYALERPDGSPPYR
ncbi:phosphate uptake regulator, PhoU [mine drainage metagenome]|uniref:Phosphate uptake regulator, PhoU n=1 Tax=mine drainage metagenome TaxID=410659 RepID=T1AJJ6_9ZZZZ